MNVKPVGVECWQGEDLKAESISSVGGLIECLCSGLGTFDLFVMLLSLERCICRLQSTEDMILALAGQFKQLSYEPEKFR